jgi:hypothetical protein
MSLDLPIRVDRCGQVDAVGQRPLFYILLDAMHLCFSGLHSDSGN